MKQRKQRHRMAHKRARIKRIQAAMFQAISDAVAAFGAGLIDYREAWKQATSDFMDSLAREIVASLVRRAANHIVGRMASGAEPWRGGVLR